MRATAWMFVLFAGALALRLGFILETHDVVGFTSFTPGLDLDLHWRAADHILEGRELSFELSSLSAPLFAYVLAAWKWIAGDSILAFRIVAAFLGALRVIAIAGLCRRWGLGRAGATVAAGALAVLPSVIYFDTMPNKVGLELSLLVALLFVVTSRARLHPLVRGCVAGLVLALLLASQLNTSLYVLPVAVYLVLANERMAAAAMTATVALALVLFMTRDPGTPSEPGWFLPRTGIDLAVGFHDGAGVAYHANPDVPGNPFGHAFVARIAAENELGTSVSQAEADRVFRDRALAWIVAHPGGALDVFAQRARMFFNNTELAGDHSLYRLRRHSRIARIVIGFGCVLGLAGAGIVACWRDRSRRLLLLLLLGIVAVQLVVTCATNINWRYRLPAVIPFALLAGVGADHLVRAWCAGVRRRMIAPVFAIAVGASISFAPAGDANHQSDLALAREHELATLAVERASRGTTAFDHAMHLQQQARYTEAYDALAAIEPELGDHPEAARAYLEYLLALGARERARTLLARYPARTRDAILTARGTPFDAALRSLAVPLQVAAANSCAVASDATARTQRWRAPRTPCKESGGRSSPTPDETRRALRLVTDPPGRRVRTDQ